MRFQPLIRRISLVPAIAAAVGFVLAGCGSSGSSTPSSSSSPAGSSSAGSSSAGSSSAGSSSAAESAIKTNWEAFFSASTPVPKRVSLLQDGQLFKPLIEAQSKSSLASSASAKVTKVTNISSSQATVTYSILVAGTSALSGQKGVAVNEDGTWKVGIKSFCGLLGLEKSSGLVKISALPAACSSG
jgi:hypothetical protein